MEVAGPDLAKHCEEWAKAKGNLKQGDFAVTKGAKLKCKKVFHICCPHWTDKDGEKVRIVSMCMSIRLSKYISSDTSELFVYTFFCISLCLFSIQTEISPQPLAMDTKHFSNAK